MTIPHLIGVHPAWLPPEAFSAIGSRRTLVQADESAPARTVRAEVADACARHGGALAGPGE
ncbi:hypothetical protein AB0M50_08085, partial [Nonomuraea fuscirosea]